MNEKQQVLEILDGMMENQHLWGYVISRYEVNLERIILLEQILQQLDGNDHDEILWKVMEYGSKIREEDHIARQMFLWLYNYV